MDFSAPFIYGNYMYFITTENTQSDAVEYIARIDLTDKSSKIKLITQGNANITSFTVFHNKLYYLVKENSDNGQNTIYTAGIYLPALKNC